MPSLDFLAAPSSPAMASKNLQKALSNTSLSQTLIPDNMALAKRYFPSIDFLGLGANLLLNQGDIFPFKDNALNITDIEVPTTILVLDKATSKIQFQTNKFLLQSITKPNQEKFQIIETFGEPSVYFYGERTKIYTIQGLLLDAEDPGQVDTAQALSTSSIAQQKAKGKYYWATAFQDLYTNHLRGTILKSTKSIAALYVNNWFIKGYPIQLVIGKDANTTPQAVTFQMTWVVETETLISQPAAQWLYKNNRVGAASAQALNDYLDAINKYDHAYAAWNKSGEGVEVTTDLSQQKDAAAVKVAEKLRLLQAALAKDAGATSK